MSEVAASKGTIHDQGYERYQGPRLAQSRRFLVIARNVLLVAWRAKWSVKLPVFLGILTLVISAGIMVAFGQVEARFHGAAPGMLRADTVLLVSMFFFRIWAFILTATVAAGAITEDLRAGAFQFYFSRPLRADDYVRGKLLGLIALVGMPMFGGPVVLAIIRVCLASDAGDALRLLPVVPKAMAVGLIATLALVLPAAGLGALLKKRMAAQVGYAVYYLLVGLIVTGLSVLAEVPAIAALSTGQSIDTIASAIFDVQRDRHAPPVWAASVVLLAFTVAGYVAIRSRIKSAESAGLAGGS